MRRTIALLLVMMVLALAACGSNGQDTSAKKTATAAMSTAVPSAIASPRSSAIGPRTKDVDFSQLPEIRQEMEKCLLRWRLLGSVTDLNLTPCRLGTITYADLTGDGNEEAIVPVEGKSAMGRLPVLAIFVYGYQDATLRQLLFRDTVFGPLTPYVGAGKLAIGETDYGPGEPACCPSVAELTTYRWDGSALVSDAVETAACSKAHPVFGPIACPRA